MPLTLITDNMAAHILRRGGIRAVFVGADRIAANGDIANKIGTYGLAVLAHAHGVPFYVVAPRSTSISSLPTATAIPIEERAPDEVTHARGVAHRARGVARRQSGLRRDARALHHGDHHRGRHRAPSHMTGSLAELQCRN